MFMPQLKAPFKKHLIFEMDFLGLFRKRQTLSIFNKVLQSNLEIAEVEKISKLEKAFSNKISDFRTSSSKLTAYMLIEVLENLYFFRDNDTVNHFKRVGKLSGFLAEKYTGSPSFASEVEFFSAIHDIGKIGVPENVIEKNGELTKDEFEIIKKHTETGYKIIENLELGDLCENIVRYHHEKWNGTGYEGLVGEDIPIEARIVAFADVYDALRKKRCYKKPLTHEKAREIIVSEKGTHFDPKLVDIFLNNENELKFLYENF